MCNWKRHILELESIEQTGKCNRTHTEVKQFKTALKVTLNRMQRKATDLE
jgi:hypothetical protein